MKILMIIDRYIPLWGGAENQLRQLIPHLQKLGCEITVLTRRWSQDMAAQDSIDGIPVYRVGLPGKHILATLSYLWGLQWYVLTHRNSIDIIHTHGAAALGAVGVALGKISHKPNVAKVASADRIPILEKSALGRIVLSVFKQSNAMICLSKEIHKQFQRINIPEQRIKHIKNAVDASRFHPLYSSQRQAWREKRGFNGTELLVLFCGNFRPIKGLDILVEAWPRVSKAVPQARLLILGHEKFIPGSVKESLQKKIQEGQIPHINFEGETPSPELYYGAADLLAMPSRQEGFPNVLMEAMACELATVSSDTCGINELIIPGENGILVPADDPGRLADAMITLLQNPDQRASLGKKAREYVVRNLTFQQIAGQYFQLYNEVITKT